MSCPVRKYPLRQPKNYRPPVPRWQLRLPEDLDRVFTAYVGLQRQKDGDDTTVAAGIATKSVEAWLKGNPPMSHECFEVVDGDDEPGTRVWVCYYTDSGVYEKAVQALDLSKIYASLRAQTKFIGLWCERFSTSRFLLETNYSGLDYLPGLARLPGTTTVEHTYSAYWGAARDRIPDSGEDLFEKAADAVAPAKTPAGSREHLSGSNYENMVHIRSGQFWENCNDEETESYETKLEPTLKTGLGYLWENPLDTGTIGLRFMRNTRPGEGVLKETCGAGFFRSLGDLENWAEKHPSHKAIYLGAIKHAKFFGESRKFRTWHEVSVLKRGDATFEYVNCLPRTGAIRSVNLEKKYL
ncbi:heme-containing dehydratase protein [Leptodontidium sp. MPI-SDFR-AT-0119]|nr:heme-containing dehydratase protein [Leptodontidium sp. MPI-SDFR-AT-0119]